MNLYDKSSLILIPSAVKSGKVYSQRPENGDGDFTFTRASTATRVNENGLIESVSSNTPRLDYSGDASCPSLLLEPQRTNSYISSEYISNINYRLTQTISNIDSCILGVKFLKIERSQTGIARVPLIGSSNGDIDTFSVFAKKGSLGGNILWFSDNFYGSSTMNVKFDLSIGDWESTPSGTALINYGYEDFGNGIYRIWASGISMDISNPDSTKWRNPAIFLDALGVNEYIYITGLQAEKDSSYPTSYIPTSGSSVTRLADSVTALQNLRDNGITTSGAYTLFFDLSADKEGRNDGNNSQIVYLFANQNATSETITIRKYDNVTFGRIRVYSNTDSSWMDYVNSNNRKYAMVVNGTNVKFFTDGAEQWEYNGTNQQDNLGAIKFNYGHSNRTSTNWKQVILFPTALTDEEAIALTTL